MYEGINNNNAILLTIVISEIKPTNQIIKKIKNFLISFFGLINNNPIKYKEHKNPNNPEYCNDTSEIENPNNQDDSFVTSNNDPL